MDRQVLPVHLDHWDRKVIVVRKALREPRELRGLQVRMEQMVPKDFKAFKARRVDKEPRVLRAPKVIVDFRDFRAFRVSMGLQSIPVQLECRVFPVCRVLLDQRDLLAYKEHQEQQ